MSSLLDIARIAGRFAWLEDRIADMTGAWVATVDNSDARLVLGARSHTHAWHADLWRDRMPVVPGLDTSSFLAPTRDDLAGALDHVAGLDTTVERMVALHRVLLPRLVTAYALLLRGTNELIDAPTVRTLRLVLEDTREEAREGEMVIRSLDMDSDADAAEARLVPAIDAAGPLDA